MMSKTFAKTIVSKESFRKAVCECTVFIVHGAFIPVDDKDYLGGHAASLLIVSCALPNNASLTHPE